MTAVEKDDERRQFEQLLADFVRARPEHAGCYKVAPGEGGRAQVLVKASAYEPLGRWMLAAGRGDPQEVLDLLSPDALRRKCEEGIGS